MINPTFASLVSKSGKSLSQIARESDISLSMVSRIQSGDRTPSLAVLISVARALGVPTSELVDAVEVELEKAA